MSIKNEIKSWIKSWIYNYAYRIQYKRISMKISDPRIKVVSFDVFDTLLVRPVMNDRDLFFLISEKAKNQFGVDFNKIRYDAEVEMHKSYSNIYDIWDYIAQKNDLSDEQKNKLLELEIDTEEQLLRPRMIVFELYKKAISNGKRVIAVSDMYLPKNILRRILDKNGYDEISEIYVSCEYKSSKSMKNLFEKVLNKEGIKGKRLFHIGDNYYTDYLFTKEKCFAAYFPSNIQLFCKLNDIRLNDYDFSNPFLRIVLGFAINESFEDENLPNCFKMSADKFAKVFLFSITVVVAYFCLNNDSIKNDYSIILFASRDGYLPYLVYNTLAKYCCDYLPSQYVFVSRLAFSCTKYSSIYDHFLANNSLNVSIESYLKLFIYNSDVFNDVVKDISESSLREKLVSVDQLKELLKSKEEVLASFFTYRKRISKTYYKNAIIPKEGRAVIFDTGYSGTISKELMGIINNMVFVDKLYLCQNESNIEADRKYGTRSYVLTAYQNVGFNYLCEILLASPNGTCIGFEEQGHEGISACFAENSLGEKGITLVDDMQSVVLKQVDKFGALMNGFHKCFSITDITPIKNIIHDITYNHIHNAMVFKELFFTDEFFGIKQSLTNVLLTSNSTKVKVYRKIQRIKNSIGNVYSRR